MIDPKELSAYMSGLGRTGGNSLKAKKLKENPNYYKDLANISWTKRRKEKAGGDKLEQTNETKA